MILASTLTLQHSNSESEQSMTKYGRHREQKGESGGLVFGKRGAKRKSAARALMKVDTSSSISKQTDHGYAKKAKRRALRAVAVPEELKAQGKRTNKKLLVATMLIDQHLKSVQGESERSGGMDTA